MQREIILDDFTKKEAEYISDLILDALVDLGYDGCKNTIEGFSWCIKADVTYT